MFSEQPPPLPRPATARFPVIWVAIAIFVGLIFLVFAVTNTKPVVAINDIKICRRPPPLMDKESGSFRIAAHITNTSKAPLVLPSFYVRVMSKSEITAECASSILLASGKSCYLITGGVGYQPAKRIDDATTAQVTFTSNDWYTPKSYVEYQLKYRSLLELTPVTFTCYENAECSIKVRFRNRTNKTVTLINGTAVFLDSNGQIVDAYPFQFEPSDAEVTEMSVSDVPGAARAQQCILQVDYFSDASQPTPSSLPPAPAVH